MYGSMDEDSGSKGGGQTQQLLPPRDPAAAAARRDRLRRRSAAAAYMRESVILQHQQPVMGTLFPSSSKSKWRLLSDNSTNGQQPQSRKSQIKPRLRRNPQQQHSWLYIVLHSHSRHLHARIYQWFISMIIMLDVSLYVASTDETFQEQHAQWLYWEEGIVSTLFLVEYICRLAVIPESSKHKYASVSPWLARWRYMLTWSAIVDLVSSMPFFLELPWGWNLPNLTWIRVFRLFRILKTQTFVRSMDTVWRVLYYNREILYVAANLCLVLILITSLLMYYMRPNNTQISQEESDQFKSLTATMYLAAMMLTGQGQPEGDLPWYTKGVVLLTGVFSVAMFAIPASMLTWGFEAEAERCAKRTRQKYIEKQQRTDDKDGGNGDVVGSDDWQLSSSSSEGGDTTDDEYMAIIAGGDGSDRDAIDGPDAAIKHLMRAFQTSDTNVSGTLSMDEFVALMTDPSIASQQTTLVGMAASVGWLAQRVKSLEHETKETNAKLDRLLEILEKR